MTRRAMSPAAKVVDLMAALKQSLAEEAARPDAKCAVCGWPLEPIFDGDTGCYPDECRRPNWEKPQ